MNPPLGRRTGSLSTGWTAVSQIATMGLGASMAVVLLVRFGKSSQSDAVLAAYGVYGVLLVLCQGFRITVTLRLADGPSFGTSTVIWARAQRCCL